MDKLKGIIIVALILLAGHWDYEDAKAAQEIYCSNVETGHWPDFKNTFREECTPEEGTRYE
jgi:hypothetical protein